ncbi:hypothetical protein [Stutzerimonas nitrititolerans]|uniref:hypothetical protein n=1 Tax=Stutzerimonas nitrititolerans TaxID=2482751 RepID=UPI0028A25804|nr:hypothetical protein [Stutzerimonas nitrititolerans]
MPAAFTRVISAISAAAIGALGFVQMIVGLHAVYNGRQPALKIDPVGGFLEF